MYFIKHCFICRPSDSVVSEDAEIEPKSVATLALAVRRSNHSARSHPNRIQIKNLTSIWCWQQQDSAVSEDAVIEPKTVATLALAVKPLKPLG
jgi:hypothetical protein